MSDETEFPEADRVEGAPHPRLTETLFGQDAAEAAFLEAFATGRLHHAWLLTGPRGIGKATLAWRIARFLAAAPPRPEMGLFGDTPPPAISLQMATDHPVWRRSAALSEPRIALCRRSWDEKTKRLKTQLTVDEVRRLKGHFTMSAVDGGWRVAIIDAADEMNPSAANALLKLLEEPPADTVLLLISHQPARLLPTIRSRCRALRLAPLGEEDLARALTAAGQPLDAVHTLHKLTGGSAGDAIRYLTGDGAGLYPDILSLIGAAPRMDRQRIAQFAAGAAGPSNRQAYEMRTAMTVLALSRLARAGAGGAEALLEAEAPLLPHLVPNTRAAQIWAETLPEISARLAHARAVNLDPELVILDMFLAIETTAARILKHAA